MNKKHKPSDEELRRAIATLDQPTADDDAIDGAFGAVVRAVTGPRPPKDFSRRTMLAVRRAPLPDRRVALRRSTVSAPLSVALAVVAAATAYGIVVTSTPVATRILVRTIALLLQACLSVLMSLTHLFDLWRVLSTIGTAVAEALSSSDIALALTATALVGVLSLTALARLLSSDQESSQW